MPAIDDDRGEHDDGAPGREIDAEHGEHAGDRLGDRLVVAAEQAAHDLADDQADGIGAEHGDDGRGVETADHQPFQHQADQRQHHGRRHDAGPGGQPAALEQIDGVGAEQDELAVGEIEDAHHAGDDSQPEHDQHHHRDEGQHVEGELDGCFHLLVTLRRPVEHSPRGRSGANLVSNGHVDTKLASDRRKRRFNCQRAWRKIGRSAKGFGGSETVQPGHSHRQGGLPAHGWSRYD